MKAMTRCLVVAGLVVWLCAVAAPSAHAYLWTGNSWYNVSYTNAS